MQQRPEHPQHPPRRERKPSQTKRAQDAQDNTRQRSKPDQGGTVRNGGSSRQNDRRTSRAPSISHASQHGQNPRRPPSGPQDASERFRKVRPKHRKFLALGVIIFMQRHPGLFMNCNRLPRQGLNIPFIATQSPDPEILQSGPDITLIYAEASGNLCYFHDNDCIYFRKHTVLR